MTHTPRNDEHHPPLPPHVRKTLTNARRRRGWSYRQAGRATGVSYGHISGIEHGRSAPSVSVALALADAFRLTADETQLLAAYSAHDAGRDWRGRGWEDSVHV